MPGMKGHNLSDVQAQNRSLILRLIFRKKSISRTELCQLTGLTASTVSNIVKQLIEQGILVENGFYQPTVGRRAKMLRYNPESPVCLGLRLARDHIRVGVFSLDGTLGETRTLELTAASSAEQVMASMQSLLEEFVHTLRENQKHVLGLAIAAPGPLLASTGRIVMISHFAGWRNIPLKNIFQDKLSLPTIVEHDANSAVIAEKHFGRYNDDETMTYVLASRGVGAGTIINGEFLRSSHGGTCEIGHMSIDHDGPLCECGNHGCLTLLCSSRALIEEAAVRTGSDAITVREIGQAADQGAEWAEELLENNARFLGIGIVNLINVIGPSSIVIGDEMTAAGDTWFEAVRRTVSSRLLPDIWRRVTLKRSELDDDPVLLGTGILFLEHIFQNPETLFEPDAHERKKLRR